MADFTILGVLQLVDEATGILQRVTALVKQNLGTIGAGALGLATAFEAPKAKMLDLGRVAEVALGVTTSQAIWKVQAAISGLARSTADAVMQYQLMEASLVGLVAREMARGTVIRNVKQVQEEMTDRELRQLQNLKDRYEDLQKAIAVVSQKLAEATQKKNVQQSTILQLQARLSTYQRELAQTGKEIEEFGKKHTKYKTIIEEVVTGQKKLADVLPEAQKKAKALMDELARIAILSPYQLENVQTTFRQAMAFGFSAEQARDLTKATLDLSAALGLQGAEMERLTYNLFQVRAQGKVTALDVRQLALVGLDFTEVLRYMGRQLGINIQTHEDFNEALEKGQITWEQFTKLFVEYVNTYYAGASERLSRTLYGLKSTMRDVFILTVPQILEPATRAFTDFGNKILNVFLALREKGKFTEWGKELGDALQPLTTRLKIFGDAFEEAGTKSGLGAAIIAGTTAAFPELVGALRTASQWLGEVKDKVEGLIPPFLNLKNVAEGFGILLAARLGASLLGFGVGLLGLIVRLGLVGAAFEGLRELLPTLIPKVEELYQTLIVKGGEVSSSLQGKVEEVKTQISNSLAELIPIIQEKLEAARQAVAETSIQIRPEVVFEPGKPTRVEPRIEATGVLKPLEQVNQVLSLFFTTVEKVREKLVPLADAARDVGVALWENLGKPIWEFLQKIAKPFSDALSEIGKTLQAALPQILSHLLDILASIMVGIKKFADWIKPYWSNLWEFLGNIVQIALDLLVGIIKDVLVIITGILGAIAALLRGDIDEFLRNLDGAFIAAKDIIARIIKAAGDVFLEIVRLAIGQVGDLFIEFFARAYGALTGQDWTKIRDFLHEEFHRILNTIMDSLRSLWDGMWVWIHDRIVENIRAISPKLAEILGIHSESRVFYELGSAMGKGLVMGFSDAIAPLQAPDLSLALTPQLAPATAGGGMTIIVQGSVIAESELFRLVQEKYVQYNRRLGRMGVIEW